MSDHFEDSRCDSMTESPARIQWIPSVVLHLGLLLLTVISLAGPGCGQNPVQSVAAGGTHCLRVLQNGGVEQWGTVDWGLGIWFGFLSGNAVPVTGIGNAVQVDAGHRHSLAVISGGSVVGWGINTGGELGLAILSPAGLVGPATPVGLGGVSVIAVEAGDGSSLALSAQGQVWAWGNNSFGVIGNGAVGPPVPFPFQIPNLNGIIAISTLQRHALALDSQGQVWAWGAGALGGMTIVTPPVVVPGISQATAVSAGGEHSLALTAAGTVLAWGDNTYGQLGGPPPTTPTPGNPTLRTVAGLPFIVAISAGTRHSLALAADGTVWVWGRNQFGQLGVGDATDRPTPMQIPGLSNVVAIAGGGFFEGGYSLILQGDGTTRSCGRNYFGALGHGNGARECRVPVRVRTTGPYAVTSAFGYSCPASNGASVVLLTWQAPMLGNTAFQVDVTSPVPSYLYAAFGPATPPVPLGGGCELYLEISSLVSLITAGVIPLGPTWNTLGTFGETAFFLPIPEDPVLAGTVFTLQAAAPYALATGGILSSQAITCTIN